MTSRMVLTLCLLSCAVSSMAQQDKQKAARDELNRGVASFRAAQFEDAIEHFNLAVHWDPELKVGHLYLATAYAQQYIPGAETPENLDTANHAIEQYNEVLRRDPVNVTAVKGIAYLELQLTHLEKAKSVYKKLIEIDPSDPEAFYSVGVVDWTVAYKGIAQEKAKLESRSDYAMIMSPGCLALRTEHLPAIEDGIAMLTRAIDLRKGYDAAMLYMNLLYRLRADLQCGDKPAHNMDLKKANEWADLAMAERKKQAEAAARSNQGSVTGDSRR